MRSSNTHREDNPPSSAKVHSRSRSNLDSTDDDDWTELGLQQRSVITIAVPCVLAQSVTHMAIIIKCRSLDDDDDDASRMYAKPCGRPCKIGCGVPAAVLE